MPYCKNCGARITKFDKDLCPICGAKKPLEGSHSDTVEITSELDIHNKDKRGEYKPHFRTTTFVLFSLIGWTGIGFFYLRFKKLGYIWLGCNLALFLGLMLLFGLVNSFTHFITYVAPAAVLYAFNIGTGLYFLLKANLKGGDGEFIK